MSNFNVFGFEGGWDMQGQEPGSFSNMPDLRQVNDMMQKSMEATPGATPDYTSVGSAAPLFKQEIVDQLFMQVETDKLVKFFPTIYKNSQPTQNTVVEYTKQTGIGSEFADIFQNEGSAGQNIDSEFARAYERMRWISEKRNVTLQAQMVSNPVGGIGNMVQKAMNDASTHVSTRLEHAMFYGDTSINSNSIDGLKSIIRQNDESWQTLDRRNQPLRLSDIGEMQENVVDNVFGRLPTKLWVSSATSVGISNEHGDRVKSIQMPGQMPPNMAGQTVQSVLTQLGAVEMDWSYYLSPSRKKLTHAAATHATAPAVPTINSATATGDAASKFVTADAGDYVYKVVAIGNADALGASIPVASGATTIAAAEKVTITIDAADNTNVTFYNIYRTTLGGTVWYLIGQVKCAGGVSDTTFVDYNEEIPGTSDAYLYQDSEEVLRWRQMMPYTMIKLPAIDLLQPYAFAMFGTLICPVPAMVRIKNISV